MRQRAGSCKKIQGKPIWGAEGIYDELDIRKGLRGLKNFGTIYLFNLFGRLFSVESGVVFPKTSELYSFIVSKIIFNIDDP